METTLLLLVSVLISCSNVESFREEYHQGKRYLLYDQEREDWDTAAANCESNFNGRGQLVTVVDEDENYFLRDKFQGESFWLGGNQESGEWRWPSQCTVSGGYTNWESEEYEEYRNTEHCISVPWYSYDGKWNRLECSRHLNYACEERGEMRCAYFRGRTYKIFDDVNSKTDWVTARKNCLRQFVDDEGKLQGQLVIINDTAENRFLRNEFRDKNGHFQSVWLGSCVYSYLDDAWRWITRCTIGQQRTHPETKDENTGYTNWVNGVTPKQFNNGQRGCLQMRASDGRWIPEDHSNAHHYACEKAEGESYFRCREGWFWKEEFGLFS